MDNRDMNLVKMLESGGELEDEIIVSLIEILSRRRLGPDTLGGERTIDIRSDDHRVRSLLKRCRAAEVRAFELIKASNWYRQNHWPTGSDPHSNFRDWVDRRLSNFRAIASGHYSDPVGDC